MGELFPANIPFVPSEQSPSKGSYLPIPEEPQAPDERFYGKVSTSYEDPNYHYQLGATDKELEKFLKKEQKRPGKKTEISKSTGGLKEHNITKENPSGFTYGGF